MDRNLFRVTGEVAPYAGQLGAWGSVMVGVMLEPRRLAAVAIPDFDVQVVAGAATVIWSPTAMLPASSWSPPPNAPPRTSSPLRCGTCSGSGAPGTLVATRDSGPPR
jgi:hypothetical protein